MGPGAAATDDQSWTPCRFTSRQIVSIENHGLHRLALRALVVPSAVGGAKAAHQLLHCHCQPCRTLRTTSGGIDIRDPFRCIVRQADDECSVVMAKPRVLVVAGTHGNEINGPWLLEQWASYPALIDSCGLPGGDHHRQSRRPG